MVQLKIYDTSGRLVTTLVDDYKKAGEYFATWDAANLSSGVYYYRIQAGNFTAVRKSIFIK